MSQNQITFNATKSIEINNRSVLCVGGRTTGVPIYRKVIERRGGNFVHHDGGCEENLNRLVRQLHAAEIVICQVGCISHSAYFHVKDHCKRTGKPCLFVETPSRSALERALAVTFKSTNSSNPGRVLLDVNDSLCSSQEALLFRRA